MLGFRHSGLRNFRGKPDQIDGILDGIRCRLPGHFLVYRHHRFGIFDGMPWRNPSRGKGFRGIEHGGELTVNRAGDRWRIMTVASRIPSVWRSSGQAVSWAPDDGKPLGMCDQGRRLESA